VGTGGGRNQEGDVPGGLVRGEHSKAGEQGWGGIRQQCELSKVKHSSSQRGTLDSASC
jgi:hypothetical protein